MPGFHINEMIVMFLFSRLVPSSTICKIVSFQNTLFLEQRQRSVNRSYRDSRINIGHAPMKLNRVRVVGRAK